MSEKDLRTDLAVRLMKVGVSQAGVIELLSKYPLEQIQRQLDWLPHRKAKRPSAFIVEAIRKNYSAPKEAFRAEA